MRLISLKIKIKPNERPAWDLRYPHPSRISLPCGTQRTSWKPRGTMRKKARPPPAPDKAQSLNEAAPARA